MSGTTEGIRPARRSANHAQVYGQLYATSLTPDFHEKTCGYWFTVTNGSLSHTAFVTRAGLDRWLAERGLALENDLPDYSDPAVIPSRDNWREGLTRVTGEYRTMSHGQFSPTDDNPYRMTEDDGWFALRPVLVTAAMSNGEYTLALITEDDGVRTVHTLNCNVKTRFVFDRIRTDALMR
jgi:hypothetical protein